MHTRASFWAFVCDNHDVAGFHRSVEDAFASVFLTVENAGRTAEFPATFGYTGGFYHTSVFGNVTKKYSQTAVFGVGVCQVANTTVFAVGVKRFIAFVLAAHLG